MKTYIFIASLLLFTPACVAGELHTIMTETGKHTGFLKYKGLHGGVEVVALSNDIGSAWHNEDLTVYVRDKKTSRLFHGRLAIPMGSGPFREFRCKKDGKTLLIETRSEEKEEFHVYCIYILPATEQDGAEQPATAQGGKSEGISKSKPKSEGRSK